jgi:hypothetical protein
VTPVDELTNWELPEERQDDRKNEPGERLADPDNSRLK